MTLLRAEPHESVPSLETLAGGFTDRRAMALDYLERVRKRIAGHSTVAVDIEALDGEAAACVLKAAEESGGESLVVMATYGRSGFSRFVLGSVTDRVVRHGRCPVLVAPPSVRG